MTDRYPSANQYADTSADFQEKAGPSYVQANTPPPLYPGPSAGPSRLQANKLTPPLPSNPAFAPSPDGTSGPPLSGDDPKGFMGHVKNFAPGKSPSKLLDPPPPSFLRPPPPELAYTVFPVMVLIGKGTTLDKGFPYIPPDARVGASVSGPHPFAVHDVNEQDWRRFLHDLRVAGSLSPMNRVVSGLAPLALGAGIIFGFFIVKGIDGVMKRRKKGPASQLIECWNQAFFHPRHIHITLSHGPPKDSKGTRENSQGADKNWRLIISYRPYLPQPA